MTLDPHLLDRLTQGDKDALNELACFLGLAQQSWNRIDRATQCELNAMHHAEGSLALCLSRAITAAEELIAAATAAGQPGRGG